MRRHFLRSFTFGLTGVVLGIYLFRAGLSSFNIGMVVAAGLLGSALATDRRYDKSRPCRTQADARGAFSPGRYRCSCSRLYTRCPLLLAMAFVGMLNGTGTDRSAAFSLEQAIIPGLVPVRIKDLGPGLVQRCARHSGFVGGIGCSATPDSAALARPSAARILPHGLSWMRIPRSRWSNPLPVRLCCESRSPNQKRRLSHVTSHQQPKRSSQNLQVCFLWMPSAADF